MEKKIISDSFKIKYKDGTERTFWKWPDKHEYRWSLTPSGDLLVYYIEFHAFLSIATIKDERILAIAAGEWAQVEALLGQYDPEYVPKEATPIERKESKGTPKIIGG